MTAAEFGKNRERETVYLPEEDKHIATLVVRQTLQFALCTSLPTKIRTPALVNELVEAIGGILGLTHALETGIGGAFVPGVSGGERKRVSIGEVFATGSLAQCSENSTRGLDSSTTLDFVKALRVVTDLGQKTTLATLYQAGEVLYNHFGTVILLEQGYQVFFDRIDEAKAYFTRLGFQRTSWSDYGGVPHRHA